MNGEKNVEKCCTSTLFAIRHATLFEFIRIRVARDIVTILYAHVLQIILSTCTKVQLVRKTFHCFTETL